MTNHELLELASLDAMGLLEPSEREAFEIAFTSASPSVQATVRREQLRVTEMAGTHPGLETPPGLKARVLSALRVAMTEAKQSVGLRLAGSPGNTPATLPTIHGVTQVHRWWRTAAISAVAASIVLAIGMQQIRSEVRATDRQIVSNELSDTFRKDFGLQFSEMLTDSETDLIAFSTQTKGSIRPRAALIINRDTRHAYLFTRNLPSSDTGYELIAVSEGGRSSRVLTSIAGSGTNLTAPHAIESLVLAAGETLTLRRVGSTDAVLTTARL